MTWRLPLIALGLMATLAMADLEPLAPGYAALPYAIPQPGSYTLPPIKPAGDGVVIDAETGKPVSLHEVLGDRYALLAFFYSHCDDVNGCPLSMFVFHQLRARMAKDPELARNLRLVSLSFDPQRDTPEALRAYAASMAHTPMGSTQHQHHHHGHGGMGSDGGSWRFVTTSGEAALAPLLSAYGQELQRNLSAPGQGGGDISHVLRVFLIDPQKRIRNIYSVSFLHTDLILADLQTLLAEETGAQQGVADGTAARRVALGPGDSREGYEADDYQTRSRDLQQHRGRPADLLQFARRPPLGLPPLPAREGVELTPEKVALGRKLFFDRRLSLNNTISCAMCHVPDQGFTSNELATAVGIEGRSVRRNTPTVLNVAYLELLFHDGREDRLSQQIWGPLLAKNEMGNPAVGHLLNRIRGLPDYAGLFEEAFGEPLNMLNLGQALAAYQMTLNAADSPFDRWHFGGEEDAVPSEVKRGFALFTGKAGCSQCHRIEKDHALFTDQRLHNTGVGYPASVPSKKQTERVQLAPGVFVEVPLEVIDRVSEPQAADLGRYEVTEDPADRWKFRTPSLRNVALTAPYMHDGSLSTLREVVAFYNRGGQPNPLLDPAIHPLGLTEAEIDDLVAFLESLTGSNVATLVADAMAAPIGDPGGIDQ
ncbi:MAG: photosynthetic protein synthase I [Gammaproteobacteria bacterium]|nr:MAG: photosynthetic protein synthase I [Gammaproteobacteria bacterium]